MVRGKVAKKLAARWAASFLSVVILLSMGAAPVVAVSAGWVTSADIRDGTILTRDIKRNAINSSRIRDYSIRKEDIHSGSINKYKLTSGSVNTYKIANGTIIDADIADGAAIADTKIKYATKTGYLSIPIPALTPNYSGYDYAQGSAVLYFNTGRGSFYAPIQLPHGAVLKKLTYAAVDNDASYTSAKIYRSSTSNPDHVELASVSTTGQPNVAAWQQWATSSITTPKIDNKSFSYTVQVYLGGPTKALVAGPIVIEYTYTTPGG